MINETAVCTVILIWSVSLLIIVVHPVHQDLHSASLHLLTLRFHLTLPHFTSSLPFGFTPLKCLTTSIRLHITTLHFTSLHCTLRRFSPHFGLFIIVFLTLFVKFYVYMGRSLTLLHVGGFFFNLNALRAERFAVKTTRCFSVGLRIRSL
jgi:hypothetical protein